MKSKTKHDDSLLFIFTFLEIPVVGWDTGHVHSGTREAGKEPLFLLRRRQLESHFVRNMCFFFFLWPHILRMYKYLASIDVDYAVGKCWNDKHKNYVHKYIETRGFIGIFSRL